MFYSSDFPTNERILKETTKMFALRGDDGFNIRDLADKVEIAPSVIYHYYKNKEQLLKKMFRAVSIDLGQERAKLPETSDASIMLKDRIRFQFDHATEVVAILKFYLTTRHTFPKIKSGFIPEKAYLHIEEVLKLGKKNKQFAIRDLKKDAKVIAHAINGFVLEYFPDIPENEEKEYLINEIHSFIIRALQNKENK